MTLGVRKSNLIMQFLGESFVMTLIASFMAIGFTILLLPIMNELTNKELQTEVLYSSSLVLCFLALFGLTGFLAGIYPAFFATRILPVYSLKGLFLSGRVVVFPLEKG